MNGVQDPAAFRELIAALAPWLDQLVIVGGRAHQLQRMHPEAQELDYPPLSTFDVDVAVPAKLHAGTQDVRTRLIDHGFTEEFFGDDRPPVAHYRLGGESSGFYAEFLTPLVGGGHDRQQRRKSTTEIGGVTAQRLRHMEILLSHP